MSGLEDVATEVKIICFFSSCHLPSCFFLKNRPSRDINVHMHIYIYIYVSLYSSLFKFYFDSCM